jgi:phosphate-selective porin
MTTRLTSTLLAGVLALAVPQITTAQTTAPAPKAFTPTIAVGGYLQPELDAGAQGDTRFPSSDRIFLRRARVTVGGKALPSITYKLQGDFAGGLGSATSIKASLTDGYVEWTRFAPAHVRVGQFKAGFGEEWLTPSTNLITVERTLATDRLTLNRQIGAQVAGEVAGRRLSYSAGLFNGNGRNVTINDNGKFLYTLHGSALAWRGARSGSVRVSAAGYWATDRQLGESADFGLDSTPGTPAADNLFTGRSRGLSLDAQWLAGPWRLDAELLRDTFQQDNGVPQAEVIGRGWYVMPAAFVHARSVQVVGRYECFTPNTSRDDDRTREWLAGVTYYIRGLNKVMIDYLWVDAPSSPDEHQKLLAQWQVVF